MEEYCIELLVLAIGQILVIVIQHNRNKKLSNELKLVRESNTRVSGLRKLSPPVIDYWEYNEPKELIKFLKESRIMRMNIIATGSGGSKNWIVYQVFEGLNF